MQRPPFRPPFRPPMGGPPFQNNNNARMPHNGMRPPNGSQRPPMNPMMNGPPGMQGPSGMHGPPPGMHGFPMGPPGMFPPQHFQPPAEVPTLPPGWIEYKTPEGTPYYHHAEKGETTWEKPGVTPTEKKENDSIDNKSQETKPPSEQQKEQQRQQQPPNQESEQQQQPLQQQQQRPSSLLGQAPADKQKLPPHNQNKPPPHSNQGPPPHNHQGPPPHNNQGPPPHNHQGPPPHNYQGPQGPLPHNHQGPPPHNHQGPPPHNHQGPPPHNHQGPPPHRYQGPPPHERQGPPHQGPLPQHEGPPPHNNQGPPPHRQGPPPDHQGPPMNQPPAHLQHLPPHLQQNLMGIQQSQIREQPVPKLNIPEKWIEHQSASGNPYYFNEQTKTTTWDRPVHAIIIKAAPGQMSNGEPPKKPQAKAAGGDKPAARITIPDSFWLIVKTQQGKIFYFNTVSKTSEWELPLELEMMDIDTERVREMVEEHDEKLKAQEIAVAEKRSTEVVESHSPKRYKSNEKEEESVSNDDPSKQFRVLLEEKNISAFSTWEKEMHNPSIMYDARFKRLSTKERKQIYDRYSREMATAQKSEVKKALKKNREKFKELLEDLQDITAITFSEFSAKHSRDKRFKSVEKWKDREVLFNEAYEKAKADKLQQKEESGNKLKNSFMRLLKDKGKVHVDSEWRRVRHRIDDDKRYSRHLSSSEKEQYFEDYRDILRKEDPDYMRKKREKESLRKREEEVRASQKELHSSLSKEKSIYQKDETVKEFKSLLRDFIKKSDISWDSAKSKIRNDRRWSKDLSRDEKERYFYDHLESLKDKLAKSFCKLIDETPQIKLSTTWREAKTYISDDARFERFGDDETREDEYRYHLRQKQKAALSDIKQLYRETKFINHKTQERIENDPNALVEVQKMLEMDKRYNDLQHVDEERTEILMDYIKQLAREGTPPPPTATFRDRRIYK